MPLTSASSATAYATIADFTARFDVRWAADLLSDTGQRLTPVDVSTNTTLTTLLQEASGLVESAIFIGKRYQSTDLAVLTGVSREMLRGMVAGIAAWLLWERRPDRQGDLPKRCEIALQQLEGLKRGDRIFSFDETALAGKEVEIVEPLETLVGRTTRLFGVLDLAGTSRRSFRDC